jgi:Putative zinc-finger
LKVLEFHPDELLEREIRGALTGTERARLETHVRRCQACRLERQLRADFNLELGRPEDGSELQLFVRDALEATLPRGAARRSPSEPRSNRPSKPSRRWRVSWLLTAALGLFAGIAVAHSDTLGQALAAIRAHQGGVVAVPKGHSTPSGSNAHRAPGRTLASPNREPVAATPKGSSSPAPTAKPEPSTIPAEPIRTAHGLPSQTLVANGRNERAVGGNVLLTAPVGTASAAALFERANDARRGGNFNEASSLYLELRGRFPNSPEARLSLAILARAELDQGRLGAALADFDAYLETGGAALREQALSGRALTLQRLGRRSEEVEAWRALLAAYPDSAYGGIAQGRIEQPR